MQKNIFHLVVHYPHTNMTKKQKDREKASSLVSEPSDELLPELAMSGNRLRIGFIHPDLGIGGAERLVVDAAVGIQSCGHEVEVFTSHCDPSHSFVETQDGTLKVRVYGDFLPQTVFGRFKVLFAIIRMMYVTMIMLWRHWRQPFDIIFIDQVSFPIPFFKWFAKKSKVCALQHLQFTFSSQPQVY
jgi:alpha-1,3/alpha-1,6-mannosyltransferase